ncbi:MAG: hypothetical protein RIT45_1838, partial [Pseudomonadota bacterium]
MDHEQPPVAENPSRHKSVLFERDCNAVI